MSSRSTVWDPVKLAEHKEKLHRTEFGTLTARVKAVNETLEKARQQFLETYCGINGHSPGQFVFETDVAFRVQQMIDKFGHKQQLHDDRPKFYGNSVYLAMFERLCACAEETLAHVKVSDECRFYGVCSLKLELLHALLTGRFRGAVRARASDIVSTRTFLNVKSPRSSNKFAQRVTALLRQMAEHAGQVLAVGDMPSCLEAIGTLKNRYLQVFCHKLEGHEQQPNESVVAGQPGAPGFGSRQNSMTPSSHSHSADPLTQSPQFSRHGSGSLFGVPGIPTVTPIPSDSSAVTPEFPSQKQDGLFVANVMQELFQVNQRNQHLQVENLQLRSQNEALRLEVLRLQQLFTIGGHVKQHQHESFNLVPPSFGEQDTLPDLGIEGFGAANLPELDFEMRDITSIPNC